MKNYYDNSRFGSGSSASVGGEPPLSSHVGELPAFSRTEELRNHNKSKVKSKESHNHNHNHKHSTTSSSSNSRSVGGHGVHHSHSSSKGKSHRDDKHKHHKSHRRSGGRSKDKEKDKTPHGGGGDSTAGNTSTTKEGDDEQKLNKKSKSKKSSKRTEKYKKRLKENKEKTKTKLEDDNGEEGDDDHGGENGACDVPVLKGEETDETKGEEKKVAGEEKTKGGRIVQDDDGDEVVEEYIEEEIVEEDATEDEEKEQEGQNHENDDQRDYFDNEEYPDSDDEYGDSDDDFDDDDDVSSFSSSSQYTTITVETAAIVNQTAGAATANNNLSRTTGLVGGLLNRWGNRGAGASNPNSTKTSSPTTTGEATSSDKTTIDKNTQVLVDGKKLNKMATGEQIPVDVSSPPVSSSVVAAEILKHAVNDITKLSIKMKHLPIDEQIASQFLTLMRGDNRSWEAIAVDILRQKARWDTIELEDCTEVTTDDYCQKNLNGHNNNSVGSGEGNTSSHSNGNGTTVQQNGGGSNVHNSTTEPLSYLDLVISHILSIDACGSLHLSSMVWTPQTAWSMQALTFSKSLHKLQLDLIDLNTFAVPMLIRGIRHNSSLKILTMSRCGLQDDKLGDLLAHLPKQLEELRIFGNSCRLKGLASLTGALSQKETKLRLLDLSYQHVTKEEAASKQFNLKEFCDVIAKNKSLEVLDLDNTSLNDEQLDYIITALTTNRSVQELTLNHNQISGTGVALLAAKMKQMKGLKKVSMYNNGFES